VQAPNVEDVFAALTQTDRRELKIVDIISPLQKVKGRAAVRGLQVRMSDTGCLGAAAPNEDRSYPCA